MGLNNMMNEQKIKDIADECFSCIPDHHELRKFAELIVKKCAGIVADAVDHREPASTYVDKIKQHFGVE